MSQTATPDAASHAPAAHVSHEQWAMKRSEYHPFDGYSIMNTLVSLVPFAALFAFRDVGLNAALAFGIAWSAFVLVLRLTIFDPKILVWPMLDTTSLCLCAVLRGLNRLYYPWIFKWFTLIVPLTFVVVAIVSLLRRRPLFAHHAHYPAFDKGGHMLWRHDTMFRRTADIVTLGWIAAWSVMLLLTLSTIETNNFIGLNALNIIFNYIVPFVCLAMALFFQALMGRSYDKNQAFSTKPGGSIEEQRGYTHPAGPDVPATPTSYSTEA